MQTTTLMLGLVLAVTSFLLGRSLLITSSLRRRNAKNEKVINNLRTAYDEADGELACLRRTLATIYTPFTAFKREYLLKSFEDLHVVYMRLRPADGEITIPVKVFFDEDDPEFALREAEEFKEKCEEE